MAWVADSIRGQDLKQSWGFPEQKEVLPVGSSPNSQPPVPARSPSRPALWVRGCLASPTIV